MFGSVADQPKCVGELLVERLETRAPVRCALGTLGARTRAPVWAQVLEGPYYRGVFERADDGLELTEIPDRCAPSELGGLHE
jgi:hypothetical protein